MEMINFSTISYEKVSDQYPTCPKEYFIINTNKNAMVKISYMNDHFKKILDNINEEIVTRGLLVKGTLKKRTSLADISINNKVNSVFLSEIYFKLERQGNGEKGYLVTKRFSLKTNLFFFEDKMGYKFLIYVAWDRREKGWSIIAREIDSSIKDKDLPKGSFVFYRNSF